MTNFKIRGTCDVCKQTKWFVRQREVRLPMGATALSHDLYCNGCNRSIQAAINNMKTGNE